MLIILISIYIIVFICYFYGFFKYRPENFPPGPPRLPLWGSYWFLLWNNYKLTYVSVHNIAKKMKTDILGFYSGPYPTVITFSHELCKELLVRPEFQGRMDTYVPRLRGFGKLLGIFFIEGPFWQEQRRFALRHMRDYGFGRRSEVMENIVQDETLHIINILRYGITDPNDKDISTKKGHAVLPDLFYAAFGNAVMMVIAGQTFPKSSYRKLREVARAALAFQRSGDSLGGALTMTPWLRFFAPDYFGYTPVVVNNQILLDFMKEVIIEHKNNFTPEFKRDFIDHYLEELDKIKNGKKSTFTDEQLLMTAVDFLFPSLTATTIVLSFLFERLILNPEVQTKIQNEIDRVVGRGRLPTLDDRPNLPYTEAAIRESMRIEPLNPLGVARRCTEDTYLGGHFIPNGTMLLPSFYTINLDPDIWGDPHNFRPERWLDESGCLNKKDLTMPFGAGKRLCAGETFSRQNMFLFFSGLMQNFTFKVPDGSPPPDLTTHIPGFNISPREFVIEAVYRD